MKLSPDETVFWEYGFINLNLTIVTTWAIMLVLTVISWWITKNLKKDLQISRWQSLLEIVVITINNQIEEIGISKPAKYIGFIGTLFLFIATANLFIILPWYQAPTGSISTTTALAVSVFLAVPFFGIAEKGIKDYLKSYVQPTIIMLPFNLISEVSRTLALAIRLFGNMMSGGIIVAILLSVAPLLFPIIMNALGLLTGMVQAYIFSILATVYIAAAVKNTKSIKT
ncbi:MAG: F0F1 ATP synthase subunit A [Lutibacter sp.]